MSLLDKIRAGNNGTPIMAVIYARYSSDNQRDESIDAQVRAIEEFAKGNGIIILEKYIDRAKSATTDKRPEFQRMMREVKNLGVQLVIVQKLDRFARNRSDSIGYRAKLQGMGIKLFSILEPFDDEQPENIILQAVLEAMGEFYSRNLAREVRKGLKENALKCKHTGGYAPLGYNVDPNTKLLVVNEQEAEAVRMIFQMTIDGASYETIARALKQAGFKTKAGNDFGKNSIYEILCNEKYIGIYTWARTSSKDPITKKRNNHKANDPENVIVVEGGVPRIISDEDFNKVQEILGERKNRCNHSERNRETYLLSGKIFCGNCGARYVGNRKNSARNKNKVPNITYRCNTRDRKTSDACKNREINRDYIEGVVIEELEKTIFNREVAESIRESFEAYISAQNAGRIAEAKRLRAQIEGLEQKEKNILNTIAEGTTKQVREIMLNKLDEIASDKVILQEALTVKEREFSIDIPSKLELEACFEEARKMFKAKTLSSMKNLIDLYVEKVIVYEDEVEVILNLVSFIYRRDFTRKIIKIKREYIKRCKRDLK
ncbi:MAG: recombinase family protein [Selenomonadaceae bacterium]|nr:recombinase family protein [Selenomonadaceae bacterium]